MKTMIDGNDFQKYYILKSTYENIMKAQFTVDWPITKVDLNKCYQIQVSEL